MQKITLEKYFNISEYLNDKTKKDFTNYRDNLDSHDFLDKDEEKLDALLKFTKITSEDTSEIFENIDKWKKIILIIACLLGFLITFFSFHEVINVKFYLFFSVGLSLVAAIISTIMIYSYKFPHKYEKSYLGKRLSKIFNDELENDKLNQYSHVIKTYSQLSILDIFISWTIGVLFATILTFWAIPITFISGGTYTAKEVVITKVENVKALSQVEIVSTNSTTETLKPNKEWKIESHSYWSKFITIFILIIIIFKFIVRDKAKKNMSEAINDSLVKQGEYFVNVMNQWVEITPIDDGLDDDTIDDSSNDYKDNPNKNIELFDYYVLYYNMDLINKDKINFNFSDDSDLNGKTSSSYSFSLFKKEDEDENTIATLQNLVIIFVSPETYADETFKKDIKAILTRDGIKQIWIVPLVESADNYYISAKKGDAKYDDWQKMINEHLNNYKVRLYNEK